MTLRFRPLKAEEVECRVSQCTENGASLLLYKDARCDMRMLDEAVGPERWQKRYESIDGKLFCSIGIEFDGRWIWKQDVGTPSNMEADKGHASDAFKRAGFCWGIGRELYTAPRIWVPADRCRKLYQRQNGKWACFDDFRVTELEVEDGRIVKLQICNASDRMNVVYGIQNCAQGAVSEEKGQDPLIGVKKRLMAAINRWAELNGADAKSAAEGIRKRPDYEESAEWFEQVAYEFEEACNGA